MNLSYRGKHVFRRNLVSYKRFVLPTLVVSLVEPLFYLVTFGIGMGAYMGYLGGKPYLEFLVPGVLLSGVMMTSSFECLYDTFLKIVHQKLYDSLIATPISAEDAIAGEIAWGAFRGLVNGVLVLVMAAVMGVRPPSAAGGAFLLLLMALSGVLFGSLAIIVTSFAPTFDFFNYYTELVITPMLFFSGVFFPLDSFPGWMKAFSRLLPLTHAVELSRAVFTGERPPGIAGNLLYLVGLAAVAFFVALRMMKRRLIK